VIDTTGPSYTFFGVSSVFSGVSGVSVTVGPVLWQLLYVVGTDYSTHSLLGAMAAQSLFCHSVRCVDNNLFLLLFILSAA
jgi:hypothetical protein